MKIIECSTFKSCKNLQFLDSITALPVPMFAKNLSGRYIYFNNEYINLFGRYHSDKMLGRTVYECGFPKEIADKYFHQDALIFSGVEKNQIYDGEISVKEEIKKVRFYKTAMILNEEISGIIGMVVLI